MRQLEGLQRRAEIGNGLYGQATDSRRAYCDILLNRVRDGERRLPVPGDVRELHVSRRAVVAGGWAEHQADGAQHAHGHDDAADEECAPSTLMDQFGRVDFQATGQACKSIELIDKQWPLLVSKSNYLETPRPSPGHSRR